MESKNCCCLLFFFNLCKSGLCASSFPGSIMLWWTFCRPCSEMRFVLHSFFFYRNMLIFFSSRGWIFLVFLPIFAWKCSCEYSLIIVHGISVFECIWCVDGVEVILSQAAGIKAWCDPHNVSQKCYQHRTYGELVLVLLLFGYFCRLEKGRILYSLVKTYNCIYLQIFNTQNSFSISASGLFLKYS